MTPERVLAIKNSVNLRELGGYPAAAGQYIAWHKLLRSGTLSLLNEQEAQALADYGVSFDIDLRSHSETHAAPDNLPRSISFQHLSVYPFADRSGFFKKAARRLHAMVNKNESPMLDTYLKMLTDSHANEVYHTLIEILLEHDQPNDAVLFHCTAGKDRTGVAAMIIEGALGVPDKTIREDYLLTNLVLDDPDMMQNKALTQGASEFVNQMNAHQAEVENYDNVAALIKKEYGSWEKYFTGQLGFSKGDLKDFQEIYLQNSPDPQ